MKQYLNLVVQQQMIVQHQCQSYISLEFVVNYCIRYYFPSLSIVGMNFDRKRNPKNFKVIICSCFIILTNDSLVIFPRLVLQIILNSLENFKLNVLCNIILLIHGKYNGYLLRIISTNQHCS